MTFQPIRRLLLCVAVLPLLAACGGGELPAARQWMEETRRNTPIKITTVSEPKRFTPFTYTGKSETDPYSPTKLADGQDAQAAQAGKGTGLRPDMDRVRDPLEAFPLDTLKMVGTMQKHGVMFALLKADRSILRARVGNHIGQNFGLITKITESQVELTEVVQDASSEWVERSAKLELQEIGK